MAQLYRGGSPGFDIPEYPQLRRVKPLPKRRRMVDTSPYPQQQHQPNLRPQNPPSIAELQAALGPNVTAEEFAAHAAAMQSYYMPMFSESFDFIQANLPHLNVNATGGLVNGTPFDMGTQTAPLSPAPIDYAAAAEDDDHGEGDYIDHLQQPGHTKKRKVPATNLDSPGGHDSGGAVTLGGDGDSTTGLRMDDPTATGNISTTPFTAYPFSSKGKTTAATKAGLRHKEMLKNRKRQLAAVLGALSQGDTFALDQALSAKYPFAKTAFGTENVNADAIRVRLSRRPTRRLSRRAALSERRVDQNLPHGEFSFYYPSATSDRLIATKEEVAILHQRFEAELAKQAEKAAEAARAAALAASKIAKKNGRQSRPKAIMGPQNSVSDSTAQAGKPRTGKKKKRAAMANASNPHHLRNYVPSRLPNSGPPPTSQENLLFPFPLRFLSADIPPRRRQKAPPTTVPASQLNNPYDEWICPFCESSLFYGEEAEYKLAVRARKKILARRRRARERAAAAASGTSRQRTAEKNVSAANDDNPGFDPAYVEADAYGRQARIATGRGGIEETTETKDRDKGSEA